jgi:hypothetical protein
MSILTGLHARGGLAPTPSRFPFDTDLNRMNTDSFRKVPNRFSSRMTALLLCVEIEQRMVDRDWPALS